MRIDRRILVGQKFGRLRVIRESPLSRVRRIRWECLCDCGKTKHILGNPLTKGIISSCGCYRSECVAARSTTHGKSVQRGRKAPTYMSWIAMKSRCLNPNAANYPKYGGSGITIHERWAYCFENFYADMGERPSGTSIDRIDPYGNYEPGNCRWATPKEQSANRRVSHKRAA